MPADRTRRWFVLTLPLLCAAALSCRGIRNTRPYRQPPPPEVQPIVLPYTEEDAFDVLFETALVNQDPVILIQTDTSRPDWGPRLNAWIAAWNRGGKVVEEPSVKARMQAPLLPATVNGETLREFRLLVDDLMTRVEDLARRGSSWWAEERTQRRRIDLLKPYSLRFHMDENQKIQLIFFNGMYSRYYRQFLESLAARTEEEPDEWTRAVQCSHCKKMVEGRTAQRVRVRSEKP
jgi:hypothetical protein